MRVLILDIDPWRKPEIRRIVQRYEGMTAVLEHEVDAQEAQALAFVILVSEKAVREQAQTSLPHIRCRFPNARILILGDSDDAPAIAGLVTQGADGYFLMSLGAEPLVKAINVVARGSYSLPDNAAAHLARTLRAARDETDALSEAEQTLLTMVDEGLTNDGIADRLGLPEMAVKRRLSRLYRRFRVRTRAQLLEYATRKGILPPRNT
jgi:DNA-binding NarL/FixJ family response regulator